MQTEILTFIFKCIDVSLKIMTVPNGGRKSHNFPNRQNSMVLSASLADSLKNRFDLHSLKNITYS